MFCDVLFRSFCRVMDGMDLTVGRQMRLIRCCRKIFQLVKLDGFAVVSRRVLWYSAATGSLFGGPRYAARQWSPRHRGITVIVTND